jgi:hypothetical protein
LPKRDASTVDRVSRADKASARGARAP